MSEGRPRFRIASANPDKVVEIEEIFGDTVELLPRPADVPDVVEDGDTLLANAVLKAAAIAEASGEPAVADDTGLEVDALGGLPGVHTGRYAGDDASYAENIDKLLGALASAGADEPQERRARFRTVVVVVWPDGRQTAAEGVCEGAIATERGGDGRYGYDPVFVPAEGDGRTFAQMSPDEKHEISHRGRAFRALAAELGLTD